MDDDDAKSPRFEAKVNEYVEDGFPKVLVDEDGFTWSFTIRSDSLTDLLSKWRTCASI